VLAYNTLTKTITRKITELEGKLALTPVPKLRNLPAPDKARKEVTAMRIAGKRALAHRMLDSIEVKKATLWGQHGFDDNRVWLNRADL
jgi:hypothetical protein